MIIGIVADDVTGANDIGSMVAKAGYAAHIYPFTDKADYPASAAPDVCILDTNSRLDPPDAAYRKVYTATEALRDAGYRQFFNKTCSVFRGNIGAEFDAMLDALGREFAVVVLGFPKNGRTTINGIHHVRGVKLEESEFRHDPIHPMTRSDLAGILGSQTKRAVEVIDHTVVRQGSAALRAAIDQRRERANYVILDVTEQADLATIAAAVYDEPVLSGSSALLEELPAFWVAPSAEACVQTPPLHEGLGILCAAGSLMPQTAAQIDYLVQAGAARIVLDGSKLFDRDSREAEITRLTATICAAIEHGRDVGFHSPNDAAGIAATRQAGADAGWLVGEIAHSVSAAVAEVTARVLECTGQNRLIVAGGETSAAVCQRLGVRGMRVWEEIAPGLPSCLTFTEPPLLLVLKSGSFGSPDFFQRALDHLRSE
ncbi:MAG: four-carbon acid sugar kinase family protein [Anaerolineae bacterium]|nr:four-carbon acid sugar kinase family protein [Anaerolineae bacterium]